MKTQRLWGAAAVGSNLSFGISFKDTLIGAVIKPLTFIMVTSRATVILTVVLRVSYAPALTRRCKTAVSPENPHIPGTALLRRRWKSVSRQNSSDVVPQHIFVSLSDKFITFATYSTRYRHITKPERKQFALYICVFNHFTVLFGLRLHMVSP